MSEKSSYLQYLPPVLWQDEPDDPGFSLGGMLRIFEKILTGIADGATLHHVTEARGAHTHGAITDEIASLPRLFDPWTTPRDMLPWLASWVALRFPTLQGEPLWGEYQQRKVTAEITRIYRLRGLKAGLNRYLDLYAVGRTRPRVALDDGSRVQVVVPHPTASATVAALVTQGPVVTGNEVQAEGLVRPSCITAGAGGDLFLGDAGVPPTAPVSLRRRVWRISATGGYDYAGTPPTPRPLAPDMLTANDSAVAVAVAPAARGRPETLYVLASSGRLHALPSPYVGVPPEQVTNLFVPGRTFDPAAMCVDRNGDLLVLDRVDGPGTPNPPQVVSVRPDPVEVTRTRLATVIRPLSMLVMDDGRLLIGDGREQEPAGEDQISGNLVVVDRSNPAAWAETLLLPGRNPITAPTGLAIADDGWLYVLDAGLKPFSPRNLDDPFVLAAAEPAVVCRVDLDASPPVVRAVTEPGLFVYPTGMVAQPGRLVVCDPGQPDVPAIPTYWPRVRPNWFDVVVHFADSRLPADPAARKSVMQQAVGDIRTIVEQQKPAHTIRNPIISIESP